MKDDKSEEQKKLSITQMGMFFSGASVGIGTTIAGTNFSKDSVKNLIISGILVLISAYFYNKNTKNNNSIFNEKNSVIESQDETIACLTKQIEELIRKDDEKTR